jgi:hypothetical protein
VGESPAVPAVEGAIDTVSVSSAFGLSVWSNLPVPGLRAMAGAARADVRVWLDAMPSLPGGAGEAAWQLVYPVGNAGGGTEPPLRVWRAPGGEYFRFRYADGSEFLIGESGSQVWATWPEPLTLEDAATYLLGPVLGFVLRLRGTVCLHAASVQLGGQAVALVGPAGAGKSTLAAAFARRGVPVLSDDVAPLDDRGDSLWVQPGNPRIRLWARSAEVLFGTPDALPRLTPNWDKLYLELGENGLAFQEMPLPLGAVYVLGARSGDTRAPFVEALSPQEAMLELVANTYVNYLLDPAMRAREFELLGRLVRSVPVRRVVPHEDPARLPSLCQVLLEDFQRCVPRQEWLSANAEPGRATDGEDRPLQGRAARSAGSAGRG